jgi:hypothetical protein
VARKPPLQIEVDRRWEFEYKPPEAAFFIVVGNVPTRFSRWRT